MILSNKCIYNVYTCTCTCMSDIGYKPQDTVPVHKCSLLLCDNSRIKLYTLSPQVNSRSSTMYIHVHVHVCGGWRVFSCETAQSRYMQYNYTVTSSVPHVYPSSLSPAGASPNPHTSIHPHLTSERELSVLRSKAHLVMRSIQLKIGHDLLMQVTGGLSSH